MTTSVTIRNASALAARTVQDALDEPPLCAVDRMLVRALIPTLRAQLFEKLRMSDWDALSERLAAGDTSLALCVIDVSARAQHRLQTTPSE